MSSNSLPRLPRRTVLKWISATAAYMGSGAFFPPAPAAPAVPTPLASQGHNGYGTDPNLTRIYTPGDLWPLILTPSQRRTTTSLADVIFPEDDLGPAASALRVPDYIDEWISAPYPAQAADQPIILEGLAWLEAESQRRFQTDFATLSSAQQHQICDDIAWAPTAQPAFRKAAHFFHRFRNIAAGAYYGTSEGWKAIGYVGNTPMQSFPGPPPEVLDRLGLVQTIS